VSYKNEGVPLEIVCDCKHFGQIVYEWIRRNGRSARMMAALSMSWVFHGYPTNGFVGFDYVLEH
jgi:hypothetical protein